MVRVDVIWPPVGATELGLKEHVAPGGSPEQLRAMGVVTPTSVLSESVYVADCPALIDAVAGDAAMVKPCTTLRLTVVACCREPATALTEIVLLPKGVSAA